jgi:PKD repeat protein
MKVFLVLTAISLLVGLSASTATPAFAQGGQPPSLTLFSPQTSGSTVTINGVTRPGTTSTTVTRIRWEWGDGSSEDHWFPASHTYSRSGTYTVRVTSYQSDSLSTTQSVTVSIAQPPSGQPPSLTLYPPQISGSTVTINGVTRPGATGTTVTRIRWEWGDGSSEDHWFPASHTYSRSGTYTVRVSSYQSDGLSTAQSITVTIGQPLPSGDSYEPDNDMNQASVISAGESQSHSIIPANDVDWIKFTLSSNSRVAIWTSGSSGDTRMWLYNSSGREVAYDDDTGDGYFSRIERDLTSGTYYVKIDEYGNDNEVPSYQLRTTMTPQVLPPQLPVAPGIARVSNVACSSTDTYFILSLSGQGIPNYYYYGVVVEALGDAKIAQVMPVVGSQLGNRIATTVGIKIGEIALNMSGIGTVVSLVDAIAEEWDRQGRTNVRAFSVSWNDTAAQPSLEFLVWATHSSSGGVGITTKWAQSGRETISQSGTVPVCP